MRPVHKVARQPQTMIASRVDAVAAVTTRCPARIPVPCVRRPGTARTGTENGDSPPLERWVDAAQKGATWVARTPQHVPSSPCSSRACRGGATTTATVRTGGSSARVTRCRSPASACRSACCPTGTRRCTSQPRRTGRVRRRRSPGEHPARKCSRNPVGPRSPSPILSRRRPGTGSRLPGPRSRHGITSRHLAHISPSHRTSPPAAHDEPPPSAACGPGSSIG